MTERDLNITEGDLAAFVRSGMGSLSEFLSIPEAMRAGIIQAREAARAAREDRLAALVGLCVATALNGGAGELAASVDPDGAEEYGDLEALNGALGGGHG